MDVSRSPQLMSDSPITQAIAWYALGREVVRGQASSGVTADRPVGTVRRTPVPPYGRPAPSCLRAGLLQQSRPSLRLVVPDSEELGEGREDLRVG